MAYLPLSTANLPNPAIDPAQGSSPVDYFNIDLYSGTSASHERSSFSFQPDFVWIKSRGGVQWHQLYDAVRGATKTLVSNVTDSEETRSDGLLSFDSDGFSLGSTDANVNTSGNTYVAWAWKANGSGVSNTDGTITSTVSANTESGFSIVSYTGNSTAGASVGHGLSSAPEMIIVKNRTSSSFNWIVYHASVSSSPETDYLSLNLTNGVADLNTVWNDTAPTSSVFSLGTSNAVNNSTSDYIAYCFHSVEGFSKFGSYTGNGSADGSFIYCGFRPAFVIIKSSSLTEQWFIRDTARETYNPQTADLFPSLSNAEQGGNAVDILSNGFKCRSSDTRSNGSGATYIYMAFAENPFKYSTAR